MSPYFSYNGQCIGRVLHFLYHYAGLHIAEHATVDFARKQVVYSGRIIATFNWSPKFGESDIPIFKFLPQENNFINAEHLNHNQAKEQEIAINDTLSNHDVEFNYQIIDKKVCRALRKHSTNRAELYVNICHEGKVNTFFMSDDEWFFEIESVGIWKFHQSHEDWIIWQKY